jgi:Protein of unknown function (DUF4232)
MTLVRHPRRGDRSRSRASLLAVSSLLAITGLLATPSAGFGATVPHCFSSQLALKFVSFQAATGHRFWQLAFKNVGAKCTLRGFPRVVLLNSAGHVIHVTVKHEAGPVPTVTVRHGKRGHFTFTYADGAFCGGHFHASRLRIFPPKDTGGFVFNPVPANHAPIFICTGSQRVSPVRSAPDG